VQELTEGGASVLSHIPLPLDEPVTLHCPADRPGQTVEWSGRVLLCRHAERAAAPHYQVAIRFDTVPAA
jgi:hypothetical protein